MEINDTLPNDEWDKEEIKKEIQKFQKLNENLSTNNTSDAH